ncbi:MAG: site-2 protease family protein [Nanoarchaeota archaeon]
MSFLKYDIALLILFVLFVSLFLYLNRKNLKKEGLLFLYKTKWGIKLIDKTAKTFPKTLKALSYVSIGVGYLLMAGMLYLFGKIVWVYITAPNLVREIKVPPIMPLIPYLPQAFKLDFLPPFYFIYWIVVLAVIAITHEFAHGIFMRRYNIKIKSTGFGFFPFFLPVFLAAFVEQDEKSMVKASKFQQKAVLAAGTFANILTAILFFIIMVLFFSFAFSPAGINFENSYGLENYAYGIVGIANITSIDGTQLLNPNYQSILNSVEKNGTSKLKTTSGDFFITKKFLEIQNNNEGYIFAYLDAPAINSGLTGAIYEIDGAKINSLEGLSKKFEEYSPEDKINIKTTEGNYEVVLGEHPLNPEEPWLGIFFQKSQKGTFIGKAIEFLSFKKPNIYYESEIGGAGDFIYNFLWWLVLISLSVALVNMLPMGIFDGGRFFYLTMWQITGSEKRAKKWFEYTTYFLLGLLFVMMFFWVIGIF